MIFSIHSAASRGKLRFVTLLLLAAVLFLSSCGMFGRKKDALAEDELPEDDALMTNAAIQNEIRDLSVLPDSLQNRIEEKDYPFVISEMSYEIKKMGAEIRHLRGEMEDIKKKAAMLENPLKIYNKEIILNNGTSVYGRITYQDSRSIKVETLIGYLIIERKDIVRIIENFPETVTQPSASAPASGQAAAPAAGQKLPTATAFADQAAPPPTEAAKDYSANCILVDNIRESSDRSGNKIFSGTVKNIGTRRADFVKINIVFRTNWSGGTKALTAFVKGSYHTYSSGISSDNALLPGAGGDFSLVIPAAFGPYIGYTYNINWEAYD